MREILFRGKRKDNGEWVEGYLLIGRPYSCDNDEVAIVPPTNPMFFPRCEIGMYHDVIPETLGQYTGVNGSGGVKIFEGDVVKVRQERCDGTGVIGYENGSFMIYVTSGNIYERTLFEYWYNDWGIEVIGSIHDNPELLEVKCNEKSCVE